MILKSFKKDNLDKSDLTSGGVASSRASSLPQSSGCRTCKTLFVLRFLRARSVPVRLTLLSRLSSSAYPSVHKRVGGTRIHMHNDALRIKRFGCIFQATLMSQVCKVVFGPLTRRARTGHTHNPSSWPLLIPSPLPCPSLFSTLHPPHPLLHPLTHFTQ